MEVKLDLENAEPYVNPYDYTLTGVTIGYWQRDNSWYLSGELIAEQEYNGVKVGQETGWGKAEAFFLHNNGRDGICIKLVSTKENDVSWLKFDSVEPNRARGKHEEWY